MKIETIGTGIPEAVGAAPKFVGEVAVGVLTKIGFAGAAVAYVAALVLERLPLPYGEVDNNPTRYH